MGYHQDPLVLRVATRYTRATDVTITKADLEVWRRDLRRMTKIYRSIGTASEENRHAYFVEARKLFHIFTNGFENWVYTVVLPRLKKREEEGYFEREVRVKAWSALLALGHPDMFPIAWNYRTDKHEDAPHIIAGKVDTNIRRYQKAVNDALDMIGDYIEDQERRTEKPVERRETEHLEVAGMNVVIPGLGRWEDHKEETWDQDIESFLRNLRTFANKIHRSGFGGGLRGLTLYVEVADPKTRMSPTDLTAGQYNPGSDSLEVFPLGFIESDGGTFTHEVGHRIWFKQLPNNARAHWTEVMAARSVTITKEDIDVFVDRYIKPFFKGERYEYAPYDQVERLVRERETDEEQRAKFLELSQHQGPHNDGVEGIHQHLLKFENGEKIDLEEISEYARTSPVEAFAEAFRTWVLKGPSHLGEWTRQFFERIVKSRG